jgi:hypothetical protein
VSGRREVYVRPFPVGAGTWQISRGGGTGPRWSPRGDELWYQRDEPGQSWIVSVRLSTTPAQISTTPPKDLFKLPAEITELGGFSADGERILGVRPVASQFAGDRVVEILNWFEQIKAQMPAR